MLLVDAIRPRFGTGAKTAERAPTTTGASPATIRSRSSRRSASVRPECSTAIRSPKRAWKRPSVCGCQRDLRDEHDRALSARERSRARLQVDLRLAAAGRAGEQQVRAGAVDRLHDPRNRPLLRLRQPGRLRLARHAGARLAAFPAPGPQLGRDELERACRGRAVVVSEPEREIDERRRQLVEDPSIGAGSTPSGAEHRSRRRRPGRTHARNGSRPRPPSPLRPAPRR